MLQREERCGCAGEKLYRNLTTVLVEGGDRWRSRRGGSMCRQDFQKIGGGMQGTEEVGLRDLFV